MAYLRPRWLHPRQAGRHSPLGAVPHALLQDAADFDEGRARLVADAATGARAGVGKGGLLAAAPTAPMRRAR